MREVGDDRQSITGSLYSRFKEMDVIGKLLGGSPNPHLGKGNNGGDAGVETGRTPIGGGTAVAALLCWPDHGGGEGAYMFCDW